MSQRNRLPGGNAGAWWPPPSARPPRTDSTGGAAWPARRPWSSRCSRSVSTLVAESHSNPGLSATLTDPLKRKGDIESESREKAPAKISREK